MEEKKSVLIGAKITPSMKKDLDKIAEAEERTISFLTYKAIQEYIANHSPTPQE